jgi:hypothetical protein
VTRPRIRTLKPEMWADESIGALSRDARLLFVGLVTLADDSGRFRAMPSAILGHVFPYDEDAMRKLEKWMRELESQGLVERYKSGAVTYAWLPGWERHQKINRFTPSSLPPPPGQEPHEPPPPKPRPEHRKAIPEKTRREVARRAGAVPGETTPATCHYCDALGSVYWPRLANGKPGSWVQFTGLDLDHVLAAVNGGNGEAENIVLACPACNRSKGKKLVTEWSRDEGSSRDPSVAGFRDGGVA